MRVGEGGGEQKRAEDAVKVDLGQSREEGGFLEVMSLPDVLLLNPLF